MAIDKELYRQAQEYYRQWNVAKLRERAEMAGKLSSQELWQRYLALIEFGLSISHHPSDWQRQQKLDHAAQYYERVQKWKSGGAHVHEQLRMPLEKVVAFLENHGYRYAIIGGIALSQWGVFALNL